MASGIVIHVAAGDEKRTEVLLSDRIRIGPGADCDLRLDLPADSFAANASLELIRSNGHYTVSQFDPALGITINRSPVTKGAILEDGDIVRFDSSKLALQFFPITPNSALLSPRQRAAQVAPFIEQAALESAATARRDDAKIFLREFTRELVREINPSTKILTLTISLILAGGLLYLGFAAFRELRRSRRLINDQNDKIVQLMEELSGTKNEIKKVNEFNTDVSKSLSLGYNLRGTYGNGVCLISGTYIWVDAAGRPLRHPETQTREDGGALENGGEDNPLQLTPEGKGAVAEYEVNGTGFHVGGGYILTNRHVVQPWLADQRSLTLSSSVNAKPRLTKLIAFFPNQNQASPLKLRKVATKEEDLAVCSIDFNQLPTGLPVLPLDRESEAVAIGKVVVMLGYPFGPYRLLAALPDAESRSLQERCGSSNEALLICLAQKKLVSPFTTQGHITDLYSRRIVSDAATGEGGSGAPVFGPSGRVIGVNFAVFAESNASNFAVPISFAIPLLEQSGWTPPEKPQTADNAASEVRSDSPATK